jgi:hypothetical protein
MNHCSYFSVIDAFAYFRAIVQKDEHSERALALTARCADLNPANYTVWCEFFINYIVDVLSDFI